MNTELIDLVKQIDALLLWLNPKGVREQRLRMEINKQYSSIVQGMKNHTEVQYCNETLFSQAEHFEQLLNDPSLCCRLRVRTMSSHRDPVRDMQQLTRAHLIRMMIPEKYQKRRFEKKN